MGWPQRLQHAGQRGGGLPSTETIPPVRWTDTRTKPSSGMAEVRSFRPVPATGLGQPPRGALVCDMVGPTPGHKNVDVQEVVHGKSASRPRTASVVSGGRDSAPAKIFAPVWRQRTVRGFCGGLQGETRSAAQKFGDADSLALRLQTDRPRFLFVDLERDRDHGYDGITRLAPCQLLRLRPAAPRPARGYTSTSIRAGSWIALSDRRWHSGWASWSPISRRGPQPGQHGYGVGRRRRQHSPHGL